MHINKKLIYLHLPLSCSQYIKRQIAIRNCIKVVYECSVIKTKVLDIRWVHPSEAPRGKTSWHP